MLKNIFLGFAISVFLSSVAFADTFTVDAPIMVIIPDPSSEDVEIVFNTSAGSVGASVECRWWSSFPSFIMRKSDYSSDDDFNFTLSLFVQAKALGRGITVNNIDNVTCGGAVEIWAY